MATSSVAICNSALIKCGADRISALSDATLGAELCNEEYSKCRDDLLISHPWNFAIEDYELSADATYTPGESGDPDAGYLYRYAITSSVLRVLMVNNSNDPIWKVQAGYLYTDETEVTIKAIKQVTDTTLFSKSFEEVLALKISKNIAFRLSQSLPLVQDLDRRYMLALREARSFDGQEGSVEKWVVDDWYNERF